MSEYDLEVDLRPGRALVKMRRGDARTLLNLAIADSGVPVNVSEDAFAADLRRQADGTQVGTLTCTISDGPAGEVTVSITDTLSDDLLGWYVADVEWTPDGGDPETVVVLDLYVEADVTRAGTS